MLSVFIIYAIRYGGDSPQSISLKTLLVGSQSVHIVDQWVTFIPTPGNTKGKYHCTVDLLFDWSGILCMTTDKFLFIFKTD
jgi:hypothetical protein